MLNRNSLLDGLRLDVSVRLALFVTYIGKLLRVGASCVKLDDGREVGSRALEIDILS